MFGRFNDGPMFIDNAPDNGKIFLIKQDNWQKSLVCSMANRLRLSVCLIFAKVEPGPAFESLVCRAAKTVSSLCSRKYQGQ